MSKTIVATHLSCGCPIYAEDLPLSEWTCEHGNYWTATHPPQSNSATALNRQVRAT